MKRLSWKNKVGLTQQLTMISRGVGFLFCVMTVLILVLFGGSVKQFGTRNIASIYIGRAFSAFPSLSSSGDVRVAKTWLNRLRLQKDRRYDAYYARLNGIERRLANESYTQLRKGRIALEQARASVLKGDMLQEREFLRQAVANDTSMIQLEAYLYLAQSLAEQGDRAGYNRQMETAASIVTTTVPKTDVCPGWKLEAVFWDGLDLLLTQPAHLILVWRAPQERPSVSSGHKKSAEGRGSDEWQLWEWRDLLFQLGTTPSIVSDGDFEGTVLPHLGAPKQLPFIIGGNSDDFALIYEDTQQSENMILQLYGRGETSVGLSTQPVQLSYSMPFNDAYLVVGTYRSTDTSIPLIGLRWLLGDSKVFQDNISTYVVYKQPSSDWTSFAGLLAPPDTAMQLQYWVINADPASKLQVDGLGLWRVPLPCQG